MTRTIPLFLVVVAAPNLGCRGCADDSPPLDEVAPYENDWGRWMSMAVTPDGNPAILSYDADQSAAVYAIGEIDGDVIEWTHEWVDGHVANNSDLGKRGQYTSLAIASDGTAWAAYYDAGAKALRYAVRPAGAAPAGPLGPYGTQLDLENGTVWQSGVADSSSAATPDAGKFTSIALDADENPVIAHYDAGAGGLRVAHYDGTSFSGQLVDAGDDVKDTGLGELIGADVGKYANLLIHEGTEYIAYYDAAAGDLKLAVGDASGYAIEVVDADGDVGAWPDMAFDADGVLHIAYHHVGNQDLKRASGAPGSFTIETIDDGDYVGADTAMFFVDGAPNILYFDGRNNNLKRARLDGGWQTGTVAGSTEALGYHNEVVEIDGQSYAASYDYTTHTVWFAPVN